MTIQFAMVNAYSEITEDFSDCNEWYDVTGSCGACSEGDYFSACDDSTYIAGTNSYYIEYDEFPISYSYDYYNGDDGGVRLVIVETNGTFDFEYFFMSVQANQDRIFFLEGSGEAGLTCDYTPDFVIGQTYNLEFIMLSNWTMDAYVNDAYLCSYSFNNASANRIVQTNYLLLESDSQNDTLDNLQITFGTIERVEKTEFNFTFDGGSDEGFVKSFPASENADFSNNDFRTTTGARAVYGKNVSLDHRQDVTFIGDLYLDTAVGRFGWFVIHDKVETDEISLLFNANLFIQFDARTPSFIIFQDGVVLTTCNYVWTKGNGGKYEARVDYDSTTQEVDVSIDGSVECSATLPNPLTEADDWIHVMSYSTSVNYRSWWDNVYVGWNKLKITTDMVDLTEVGGQSLIEVDYNGTLTSDVTNTTFDCKLVQDGSTADTDTVTITDTNQLNYTWSNLVELQKELRVYCENDETNATTDVYTYVRYDPVDVLATDSFLYPKLENLDDEYEWINFAQKGTGQFIPAKIDLGYDSPPDVDNMLCFGDYCQQQVPQMEFFFSNKTTINFWMYIDDFDSYGNNLMQVITGRPNDQVSCGSPTNGWEFALTDIGKCNVYCSGTPDGYESMYLYLPSRACHNCPTDLSEAIYISNIMKGRLEEDKWYMITLIHDPTQYEAWVYVNGVLEGHQKNNASINPFTYQGVDCPYVIGGRPSPEYPFFTFAGIIDELTVWGDTLEKYEINQLYNNDSGVQDIREVTTTLYLDHNMHDNLLWMNQELVIEYDGFPINDFTPNPDLFNCTLEVNGVTNQTDSDINITEPQSFTVTFGKIEEEMDMEIICQNDENGGKTGVFTYEIDTLDPRIVTPFANNSEYYQKMSNVTIDAGFYNANLQNFTVTVRDSASNVDLNFFEDFVGIDAILNATFDGGNDDGFYFWDTTRGTADFSNNDFRPLSGVFPVYAKDIQTFDIPDEFTVSATFLADDNSGGNGRYGSIGFSNDTESDPAKQWITNQRFVAQLDFRSDRVLTFEDGIATICGSYDFNKGVTASPYDFRWDMNGTDADFYVDGNFVCSHTFGYSFSSADSKVIVAQAYSVITNYRVFLDNIAIETTLSFNQTYGRYYNVLDAETLDLDNYTLTLEASDLSLQSEEVYNFEVTECLEFWVADTTSCTIFGDQVLYYVDENQCDNPVPIVPAPVDNGTSLSCQYATEECGTNEISVTGQGGNKKWTIGNDCIEVDMWLTKYSHLVTGRDLCCEGQMGDRFKLWWFGIEERDITTGRFVKFRHFNTFSLEPDITEGYLKYVAENITLSYLVNTSTLKTQLELTNYSYTNNNTELWVKIMEQKDDDDRVVFVAPIVDSVEQPIVVERTVERGDNFVYQKLGRGEHIDVDPIFIVHGAVVGTPFVATHDANDIGSVIIDFVVEFGVQLIAFAGLIALVGLYVVARRRLK